MIIRVFGDVKVLIRTEDILRNNVIYCLTFPNGKKYIGQTTQTLKERLRDHIKESFRKGSKDLNSKKARAIRKYLEFSVNILHYGKDIDDLNKMEIELISKFNTVKEGYNISSGGGGRRGIKCSEETKQKISNANKGKSAPNKRIVEKYNINLDKIEEFESCLLAANSLGLKTYGRLIEALKTGNPYHCFIWKYKDEQ